MASRYAPGRDPAAVVETAVAVALGLIMAFALPLDLSNAWSAAVVGVGGLVTAAWVAREKLLPALTGAIKAVFALVVTLGMDLNPSIETGLILAASALVTFFVRTQVVAPINSNGDKVLV